MLSNSRNTYLETEVLTATPQRLRKMLLDGAIRFSGMARDLFAQGQEEVAHRALDRCSDILAELLSGVKPEDELTRRIAGVYVFLLTQTMEIRRSPSAESLADLIDVLEIERETWKQVCEASPERLGSGAIGVREISASDAQSMLSSGLTSLGSNLDSNSEMGSFELDA